MRTGSATVAPSGSRGPSAVSFAKRRGLMSSASFFISPQQLWSRIGTADAPLILDVCRREIYEAGPGVIPTALWHKPETYAEWVPSLPTDRPIVLACRYGHNLSQMIAAELRGRGVPAQVLEGGRQAWSEAGLPVVSKAALERFAPKSPSLWITRRRPKIDRVACPWLIRRFIDPTARFLFVDPEVVQSVAEETGGEPFDVPGVELTHDGPLCSFDTLLKVFGLETEPALARLATIVRGADTDR